MDWVKNSTRATRQAMLRDWGSWDAAFNRMTQTVCADLVEIVHGENDYVCVPLQGSGTFAVEAAIGTLVPCAVIATEADRAERDRLFAAQAERSPQFADYQTGLDRVIPAIILTPRPGD